MAAADVTASIVPSTATSVAAVSVPAAAASVPAAATAAPAETASVPATVAADKQDVKKLRTKLGSSLTTKGKFKGLILKIKCQYLQKLFILFSQLAAYTCIVGL